MLRSLVLTRGLSTAMPTMVPVTWQASCKKRAWVLDWTGFVRLGLDFKTCICNWATEGFASKLWIRKKISGDGSGKHDYLKGWSIKHRIWVFVKVGFIKRGFEKLVDLYNQEAICMFTQTEAVPRLGEVWTRFRELGICEAPPGSLSMPRGLKEQGTYLFLVKF